MPDKDDLEKRETVKALEAAVGVCLCRDVVIRRGSVVETGALAGVLDLETPSGRASSGLDVTLAISPRLLVVGCLQGLNRSCLLLAFIACLLRSTMFQTADPSIRLSPPASVTERGFPRR